MALDRLERTESRRYDQDADKGRVHGEGHLLKDAQPPGPDEAESPARESTRST